MSRIAAGSAEGAEQGYHPYLQDALLMGLFMFLCTEYLYVDVLSRMVSGDRAVLAQNEAVGAVRVHVGGVAVAGIHAGRTAVGNIIIIGVILGGILVIDGGNRSGPAVVIGPGKDFHPGPHGEEIGRAHV